MASFADEAQQHRSIAEQLAHQAQLVNRAKRYLAYFQAYTSTFAEALRPVDELRLMSELFGDRAMLLRLIGKRCHVTESATAAAQRAVAVWAAKTAVQR